MVVQTSKGFSRLGRLLNAHLDDESFKKDCPSRDMGGVGGTKGVTRLRLELGLLRGERETCRLPKLSVMEGVERRLASSFVSSSHGLRRRLRGLWSPTERSELDTVDERGTEGLLSLPEFEKCELLSSSTLVGPKSMVFIRTFTLAGNHTLDVLGGALFILRGL